MTARSAGHSTLALVAVAVAATLAAAAAGGWAATNPHGNDTEDYCVQTVQRGWTYVQADAASFSPGGDWYALVAAGATVTLDGHQVTLEWLNGAGVILAAHAPEWTTSGVSGYVATCDQPYVQETGEPYDVSGYGDRGQQWLSDWTATGQVASFG